MHFAFYFTKELAKLINFDCWLIIGICSKVIYHIVIKLVIVAGAWVELGLCVGDNFVFATSVKIVEYVMELFQTQFADIVELGGWWWNLIFLSCSSGSASACELLCSIGFWLNFFLFEGYNCFISDCIAF